MDRLKYLVIGILALFLAGCGRGQVVVETLNVPNSPMNNAPGSGKSIVILPFADYSLGNLESAQRRDMLVTEALTDRLIVNGFNLPIQEDVFDYLVAENVIRVPNVDHTDNISLTAELTNDWSDIMKSEIRNYMFQIETEAAKNEGSTSGTHGLSSQMVSKIGHHFKADYIVRGRILEFKARQEPTWAIWKKGLIPFINDGANRLVFGYADSDAYDDRYGSLTSMDVSDKDLTHGKAGADDNQSTVQIRMWVQEAATGNVVWSNRIRVLVSPQSVQADDQYDALFHTAIDKGVTTLVDHFVAYGL